MSKRTNRTQNQYDTQTENANHALENSVLSTSLEKNIKTMDALFENVDTLLSRRFQNSLEPDLEFCIYFTDGVVNSIMINDYIIKPLLSSDRLIPDKELFNSVKNHFIMANEIKESSDLKTIINSVTYGDTILFINGSDKALIISSKLFLTRSTSEPESEKVLSGPREGFNESILQNLSFIRRRLRTNNLKIRFRSIGKETNTSICICYIDDIVNKKILRELYRRLDVINIDGVLDSNYITEHIAEKSPFAFPACGSTERPDIVASRLLEGRIAIFVDGTPSVLTVPYLFVENFQSNEDYYVNNVYATFTRLLRILGFLLTITIPGIYVAIVAYHHEILPVSLMVSFAFERMSVPLPASIECFVMLLFFDILREAGVRMPSQVGQSLSIVGALIIGQAAVEAKLVAAPMIIVVAITGITGLFIPRLSPTIIICRNIFLFLASFFGLYGLMIGCSLLLTHLFNLQTMGVPSVLMPKHLSTQAVKDIFIRMPWPNMLKRYAPLTTNKTRSAPKKINFKGGEHP